MPLKPRIEFETAFSYIITSALLMVARPLENFHLYS